MSNPEPGWNFFSNYAHTLICLAENPQARMRDVAERVGITERATMRIVTHLEDAGILTRHKEGRRNRYEIHERQSLRHPLESHCDIGSLLSMVLSNPVVKREKPRSGKKSKKKIMKKTGGKKS